MSFLIYLVVAFAGEGSRPLENADMKALQGEWELVAESLNGSPIRSPRGSYTMIVEGTTVSILAGKELTARWQLALDVAKEPKWMDEKSGDKSLTEIYRLDRETLTVAFRNGWNDPRRPTSFEPAEGVGIYVLTRRAR
jgi:uncharacterized protein (TIGR03067 family)